MNYIVYDTEFNQPQPKLYNPNTRFKPNPVCPFEIIEIGAVKVNENMEILDTFSRIVKPVIYRRMSPIVSRKTGLRMSQLKTGSGFKRAMAEFKSWSGHDAIFCTWSNNDTRILKRNCLYHGIDWGWFSRYYDVQKHCSRLLGLPRNETVGLKNAVKIFKIQMDGKLHRAVADAMYAAKVFIAVYNEEMKKDIQSKMRRDSDC